MCFKLGASVLAGPIVHLVWLSFRSAKIPSSFKDAIIRPVYNGKGKHTTATSSFRPIAILSSISKVLKKCAYETLVEFFEPRLPSGQYGFRKAKSTTVAIVDAHGRWSSIRAEGRILGVMGLELSAIFDALDSALLCSKLVKVGICGGSNNLFFDYLTIGATVMRWNIPGHVSEFWSATRSSYILGHDSWHDCNVWTYKQLMPWIRCLRWWFVCVVIGTFCRGCEAWPHEHC